MKKIICLLLISICFSLTMPFNAYAEGDNWDTKPVITDIYEVGENTLQVKWTGEGEAYRIYLDNKELHPVKGMRLIQFEKMTTGTHRLNIIPIRYVPKSDDSNTEFSFEVPTIDIPKLGSIPSVSISGSWDWKSIGINPKDIINGEESGLVEFTYTPSKFFINQPEIKEIVTDQEDNVVIRFKDDYNSDGYRICITQGKTVERFCEFFVDAKETEDYINIDGSMVTIKLDRKYLEEKNWLVPALNEEYKFQVQLIKYSVNLIGDQKPILSSILYSKLGKKEEHTPTSPWKIGPEMTYSSQEGAGSVLLTWEHDDYGKGCQYKVVQYDKIAVVKTGEKEIGITNPGEKQFEITDLINGKYTFAVIPLLGSETGKPSEAVTVDVSADWITAPELTCSVVGPKEVKLSWPSSPKIEDYHITVSVGSGTLLRYVNLDFKKYQEINVPAEEGTMEYDFSYPEEVDPETGVKLKFEIYGIHHVDGKDDQKSSTSKQTVLLQ